MSKKTSVYDVVRDPDDESRCFLEICRVDAKIYGVGYLNDLQQRRPSNSQAIVAKYDYVDRELTSKTFNTDWMAILLGCGAMSSQNKNVLKVGREGTNLNEYVLIDLDRLESIKFMKPLNENIHYSYGTPHHFYIAVQLSNEVNVYKVSFETGRLLQTLRMNLPLDGELKNFYFVNAEKGFLYQIGNTFAPIRANTFDIMDPQKFQVLQVSDGQGLLLVEKSEELKLHKMNYRNVFRIK